MDWMPAEYSSLGDRFGLLWERGLRFLTRSAIAFALSTVAAICVGAAVTDNALVQILVTALIAVAFWMPLFIVVLKADQWLIRRKKQRRSALGTPQSSPNAGEDKVWQRLVAVAPEQSDRLAVLRRSIDRSRHSLGGAELDPNAHDLCILIDRRLPELIHHELELLPPDDRHRREKISELIDMVEQFARHCSRSGSYNGIDGSFEAEVLRRRFEARLTESKSSFDAA